VRFSSPKCLQGLLDSVYFCDTDKANDIHVIQGSKSKNSKFYVSVIGVFKKEKLMEIAA
jgi:hypothetical protein